MPSFGIDDDQPLMTAMMTAISIFTEQDGIEPYLQVLFKVDAAIPTLGLGPYIGFQHLIGPTGHEGYPEVTPDEWLSDPWALSHSLNGTSFGHLVNVQVPEAAAWLLTLLGLLFLWRAREF